MTQEFKKGRLDNIHYNYGKMHLGCIHDADKSTMICGKSDSAAGFEAFPSNLVLESLSDLINDENMIVPDILRWVNLRQPGNLIDANNYRIIQDSAINYPQKQTCYNLGFTVHCQ